MGNVDKTTEASNRNQFLSVGTIRAVGRKETEVCDQVPLISFYTTFVQTIKDSKLVIHNPLALLVLLDLAELMDVKSQIMCLKRIHALVSLSDTLSNVQVCFGLIAIACSPGNLYIFLKFQALNAVKTLGFLLHYFPLMDLDRLSKMYPSNDPNGRRD